MFKIGVISILPEIFQALDYGICGRALKNKLVEFRCFNPRQHTFGKHRQVDDKPYGGGAGMVMMYQPVHDAILDAKKFLGNSCKKIYLSPQGRDIKQQRLIDIVEQEMPVLFVAGRFEGIDQRIIDDDIDEEWSLGDFILSGGEFAALSLIDAMIRLIPGSLGHPDSNKHESFMDNILEHPHYTRPARVNNGLEVPKVLMQGNHQEILTWRRKTALGNTFLKRPDLLEKLQLNDSDKKLLDEFIKAQLVAQENER